MYLGKIQKKIAKSISLFFDKPIDPITNEEKKIIEKLKYDFSQLPDLENQTGNLWIKFLHQVRDNVKNGNPKEFLRWHIISSTMNVKNCNYVWPELKYLKKIPDLKNKWRLLLEEPKVGHPYPYWLYPKTSGNSIHHLYHIARFANEMKVDFSSFNLAFEFGGGYGNFCRLMKMSGFSGNYYIYDFPEFALLQKFYLDLNGIDTKINEISKDSVNCISNQKLINDINFKNKKSIFIGTWSLSESPLNVRQSINHLFKNFDAFLIAYQGKFCDIDNISYFAKLQDEYSEIKWNNFEIEQLPKNYYLFGTKN